jgi:uncharacterized membrane protein (UPF0127 family)
MTLRGFFHKSRPIRHFPLFGLGCAGWLLLAGCAATDEARATNADLAGAESRTPEVGAESIETRAYPLAGYAWVIFGPDTVVAEVAATPDERAEGLMYRDEVPDGTGMLFVFQDNQPRSFWMANTYVPLDIAYMNPSYQIVDIIAMEPLVTDSYPSSAPSMFALEVRQGWFAEQGIAVGAKADIVFGVQGR